MRSSNGPLKLFIGNIGDNNKSDLSRVFSKYGEISTIYVDEKKNFAFVEFTSASDGERALQHINHKTVNGSKLRVEYAKSDKVSRDNRRPISRERSPASTFYNHLQVTANRLPPMESIRQTYYQSPPIAMMPASAMSRGRSLTPPSFKQNARTSTMSHLRPQDLYPPYYPHHPAIYTDPAYYRAYGDPYLMQRLPPPSGAFFRSTSPSSSSSRPHRYMYPSSDYDRYPPVSSHKRSSRRSRSRSRRRNSPIRRDRSSRERKRKRRTSSSSSPKHQRDRGPQTPPSSQRTKRRSRSDSNTVASTSEQKSPSTSSSSSSEDENNDDKQSDSKRSQNNGSDRKHSKRKTRE